MSGDIRAVSTYNFQMRDDRVVEVPSEVISKVKDLQRHEFDLWYTFMRDVPGTLSWEVNMLRDTLTDELPTAQNERAKNILIACLKTAILSSLVAATILSWLFVSPVLSIFLGSAAALVSILFYVCASVDFAYPEQRVEYKPSGPWFCPNVETLRGKIAAMTVVLPIVSGLIAPWIEACTRESRWERVLEQQKGQILDLVPQYAKFYKEKGETLIQNVRQKISGSNTGSTDKAKWEGALELIGATSTLLRCFDEEVPDLAQGIQNSKGSEAAAV